MEISFIEFWQNCKNGFNEVAWLLAILFGGSVLTKLFGVSGAGGIVLAIIAVYLVGRYHPAIPENKEKPDLVKAAGEFSKNVLESLNNR